MSVLFVLMGLAACGLGLVVGAAARGAPHEIEALILFLIGAVFFVGAALCSKLDAIKNTLILQINVDRPAAGPDNPM